MGGLNAILRQLDPLLSTKQRQQDEHPLLRSHPRIEAILRMGLVGFSPDRRA